MLLRRGGTVCKTHPSGLPKPSAVRMDRWTKAAPLQSRLCGTSGDLQRMAKFIAATEPSVLANKANEKKKKELVIMKRYS